MQTFKRWAAIIYIVAAIVAQAVLHLPGPPLGGWG